MRTQKDRGKQGPLKKSVKQKVLESTLKTIKREILQKIAEFSTNSYKSIYKLWRRCYKYECKDHYMDLQ